MPKGIQLHIPSPCHENWQQMTPREQGRFCGACQKTVVDFSVMTDKEILNYMSKAGHSVCGRLANDQLHKDLYITENKKRFSWAYLWNLLLATFLLTETNGQVKPVKNKKPAITQNYDHVIMGAVAFKEPAVAVIPVKIKGVVLDAATKLPVAGASIMVKPASGGTAADTSGKFHVTLEKKKPVELEFSAVGYETQTRIIDHRTAGQPLVIFLQPAAENLSVVEVTGYSVVGKIDIVHISAVERDRSDSCVKPNTSTIKRAISGLLPASVKAHLLKRNIQAYPNPVIRGNAIYCNLDLQQPGEYKLELLDAGGRVVMVQPLVMHDKKQTITVATSESWSAGIYFIRIAGLQTQPVYQSKVLLQ